MMMWQDIDYSDLWCCFCVIVIPGRFYTYRGFFICGSFIYGEGYAMYMESLSGIISFIKSIPLDVPLHITCVFSGHGDVDMLVIPRYYHTGSFRCTILEVYPPFIPVGYCSSGDSKGMNIDISQIKSWSHI